MLRLVADLTQSLFRSQPQTTRPKSRQTVVHRYATLEARQLLAADCPDFFFSLSSDSIQTTGELETGTTGQVFLFSAPGFEFDAAGLNFTSSDSSVLQFVQSGTTMSENPATGEITTSFVGGEAIDSPFESPFVSGTRFNTSFVNLDPIDDGAGNFTASLEAGSYFAANFTQNGIRSNLETVDPNFVDGIGNLLASIDFTIVGPGDATLELTLGEQGTILFGPDGEDVTFDPSFGSITLTSTGDVVTPRPSSITLNPSNGIVTIDGEETSDIALVSSTTIGLDPAFQFELNGLSETFLAADVVSIFFEGRGGDDEFTNNTNLTTFARGGIGDDILIGGSGVDRLVGGDGADLLTGNAGNDFLIGGQGDDTLIGNDGQDELFGEAGSDELVGGLDDDNLFGGSGLNTINGNDGDDLIISGSGSDTIDAGAGDDTVFAGDGENVVNGGTGNDLIVGGAQIDILIGGADDDEIFGLGANDILEGGSGDDVLAGNEGDDAITGGLGDDTGIGGAGSDTLTGDDGDDNLFGGEGDDEIFGNSGNDNLGGNDGDDEIFGGIGFDGLFGNAGNDLLVGGVGNDRLFGSIGNDTLLGQEGDDLLVGDAGEDAIFGEGGQDTVFGGDDADRIFGGDELDLLFGQGGDDVIFAGAGDDTVNGGDGNDELHGNGGDDLIVGGAGEDQLYGELGNDRLLGGADNDSLVGGVGDADTLSGNEGSDLFVFSAASITLDFNSDNDVEVEFRNGSSQWTNQEIQVINEGLVRLQQITGSSTVLNSPRETEPLVFIKDATIDAQPGNRLASNERIVTLPIFNPETNMLENVPSAERQIRFAEWDETDEAANLERLEEVPREVAFLWAGPEPVAALIPSQADYWDSFLQISGWTQTRPDDISLFDTTPDGEWYFLQSATFADDAGRLSPEDDFATVWQFVVEQEFAAPNDVVVNDALTPKIEAVTQLFEILGNS